MTSVTPNTPSVQDSDEIDLGRLFGELIDHRKLIIAITSGFTVLAILYALFATPIYQADALIQVEQKQGNAILNSLSQMLPDSQPQSAPEIALLQSRMILGKTVDDLNLQAQIQQKYFPFIGRGLARLAGDKPGTLTITRLYLPNNENNSETPKVVITVLDNTHYLVKTESYEEKGTVGDLLTAHGMSILISEINAQSGDQFIVTQLTRLKAITNLQSVFTVSDQGKDTGMLNLTLIGDDSILISKILDSISQNYLSQNIARQAAQDAKSLDFLNKQLPKVRGELDTAEEF